MGDGAKALLKTAHFTVLAVSWQRLWRAVNSGLESGAGYGIVISTKFRTKSVKCGLGGQYLFAGHAILLNFSGKSQIAMVVPAKTFRVR
ncbi:MAG TPA: hypothetical protein VF798_12175 [Burkholderiaceae bacterium]